MFRIGVEGLQVVYRKNGTIIFTSPVTPSYPLVVDTSLMASGANIYNATVNFGQGSPTPATLAAARLSPKNATGGTNLYSQNFGWGTSLVNLPGRAGLDANLGISYNSLVWIKSASAMYFDPDASNVAPGFRIGFPVVEPAYFDSGKNLWVHLMVTPSGQRVEFRQTPVSGTYETVDSSYTQLVVTDSLNFKVIGTDGSILSYQWKVNAYRCIEVKDRNGNRITNAYDSTSGRLSTMTDTLGRVVTINYDANGTPSTIRQTWYPNGNGSDAIHTWATLSYANVSMNVNFGSLVVYGPPNGISIRALDRITFADSSYTKFEYNGYMQVQNIKNYAADGHLLNYVSTNLDSLSGAQSDCPKFTQTRTWTENFNSGSEVVVNNSLTSGQTYNVPPATGPATRIQDWMTGHPNNLRSNTFVGSSGWNEGLPIATEDCLTTTESCTDRRRWTWTNFTQDNTAVSYILNPRVSQTQVGDGANTKKTAFDYLMQSGSSTVSQYGLPSAVYEWDQYLSSILRTTTTTYNLASSYTSRRIIGLSAETNLYDGTTTLLSKVTYAYDENGYSGTGQSNSPVQHDNTNYGSGFAFRGNQTSATRHDVTGATSSAISRVKYNTAGSPISQTDPMDRVTTISYSDNFIRPLTPIQPR